MNVKRRWNPWYGVNPLAICFLASCLAQASDKHQIAGQRLKDIVYKGVYEHLFLTQASPVNSGSGRNGHTELLGDDHEANWLLKVSDRDDGGIVRDGIRTGCPSRCNSADGVEQLEQARLQCERRHDQANGGRDGEVGDEGSRIPVRSDR